VSDRVREEEESARVGTGEFKDFGQTVFGGKRVERNEKAEKEKGTWLIKTKNKIKKNKKKKGDAAMTGKREKI
jgi:hypothetical protein